MTSNRRQTHSVSLTDAIIVAVSQLVDDAQSEVRRDPSHFDIGSCIQRCGLAEGDPRGRGLPPVGKAKRVFGTLSWAMENNLEAGEMFVPSFISLIRGHGGFRSTSLNYVGAEAINNAADAIKTEGYELTWEGELQPILLENLTGVELREALKAYVRRAKRGVLDAALVTGTGKDLLEATAAHVLQNRYGDYPVSANFQTLLGQAFTALGLETSQGKPLADEPPHKQVERAMFDLGCAINRLRNKEGTGHGRPWPPSVTDKDAKVAVEFMGTIAE